MSSKNKGGVQEGALVYFLFLQEQIKGIMIIKMLERQSVRATGKAHGTQVRQWMGGWSDQGL